MCQEIKKLDSLQTQQAIHLEGGPWFGKLSQLNTRISSETTATVDETYDYKLGGRCEVDTVQIYNVCRCSL